MPNITFTSTAGGNWGVAGNWNPSGSPSGDDVSFVSGTYTSTVDSSGSPWSIGSLNVNVSTVTLNVDASLTVNNSLDSQGTIVVENSSTLTVGSLNSNSGEISVSNASTLTVQNFNNNNGDIVAATGGVVDLSSNGSGHFTVTGGTLLIGGNYNGAGTIEMDNGTMWLAGQIGSASYVLGTGPGDSILFDALQATTNNSFTGASQGDLLGFKGVTISSASYSGTTLTVNTSGTTYTFTDFTGVTSDEVTGAIIGTETFQGNTYGTIQWACFAAGTRIDTPDGPVPVEALHVGQIVLTSSGNRRPVRWIGHRWLNLRRQPDPAAAQPIRILAEAMAPAVPRRDLLVSPDHALFIDDVLIPARLLVNGATIRQDDACPSITYYHVELESHDVLLAEGLPTESYLDTDRGMFGNRNLPITLHPDLGEASDQVRRETESYAPFVVDSDRVHPVWQRLSARAVELGMRIPEITTTDDPHFHLELEGQRLTPVTVQNGRYIFLLPRTGGSIRLTSRATARSELQPWIEDRRRLGIMVRRLALRRDGNAEAIPLDRYGMGRGWWAVEGDNRTQWRWTGGTAELPLAPGGPALLEVDIATMPAYRLQVPAIG